MPFQKVRYLNGSDKRAVFELHLKDEDGVEQVFHANVAEYRDQTHTFVPEIDRLKEVTVGTPAAPETRVDLAPETLWVSGERITSGSGDWFREAIVTIALGHKTGTLTIITESDVVHTTELSRTP